jgi:DNA-directed RNA polymerase I subunit RPA1
MDSSMAQKTADRE